MAPTQLTLGDLENSNSSSLKFSVVGDVYIVQMPVVL